LLAGDKHVRSGQKVSLKKLANNGLVNDVSAGVIKIPV
jgi:hypothetical protein